MRAGRCKTSTVESVSDREPDNQDLVWDYDVGRLSLCRPVTFNRFRAGDAKRPKVWDYDVGRLSMSVTVVN